MAQNTTVVSVDLSTGVSIPLRPIKSPKTGNMYHAVLKRKNDGSFFNPGKYGVKVDKTVVGGKLPTTVKVAGVSLTGTSGRTTTGNPKVTFSGSVKVNGEERKLSLRISALPSGDFNVSGSLHRPGGAGGAAATEL